MKDTLLPYFDNAIPVVPVDYTYHTDENELCWDECCPCKTDKLLLARLQQQYNDGLLTAEEVENTLKGRML